MAKRETTERVPTVERYKVRGTYPFPIDMLRYDSCYPATEEDSHAISRSIAHYEVEGPIEVTIRSRRPLTIGRWQSFGWTVVGVVNSYTGHVDPYS